MKKLSKVFAVIMLGVSLTACSSQNAPVEEKGPEVITPVEQENAAYPVTLTNYNYNKDKIPVTFEKVPEKVFCLYQNAIETMLALGLEDHIVAAAGLDHPVKPEYQEAFEKVNYLSDFELTKEAVVMLEPDFILTWMSPFDEKKLGDVDYWHERSIQTYMAPNSNSLEENKTLENEYQYILDIGKIFNVEERAGALVDQIKNEVERVTKATGGREAQRVMILEFMKDGIYVYGKNSLGGNMVTTLGGEVIEGASKTIGYEDLINLNPDIIYVVYMDETGEGKDQEVVDKVVGNEALASLKAVQNDKVYNMPLGEMYAAAVRSQDGVNRFAKGMYPELY